MFKRTAVEVCVLQCGYGVYGAKVDNEACVNKAVSCMDNRRERFQTTTGYLS